MAQDVKFTDEELTGLKEIQAAYQNIQLRMGGLKMQQIAHERQAERLVELEDQLMAELQDLNTKEQETAASLNEKYGAGSLDPESGVFTPSVQNTEE